MPNGHWILNQIKIKYFLSRALILKMNISTQTFKFWYIKLFLRLGWQIGICQFDISYKKALLPICQIYYSIIFYMNNFFLPKRHKLHSMSCWGSRQSHITIWSLRWSKDLGSFITVGVPNGVAKDAELAVTLRRLNFITEKQHFRTTITMKNAHNN